MTLHNDLPPRLRTMYELMDGKGEMNVNWIYQLYFKRKPAWDKTQFRHAQTRLSPVFSRLNERILKYGQHVTPGTVKGTYLLTSI